VAQHWETLILDEVFNVGVIIAHFSAFINKFFFHLYEKLGGVVASVTFTFACTFSRKLGSNLSFFQPRAPVWA